jgi:hypothetical protein
MLNVRYYLAPPGFPSPSRVLERAYAGRDATVFADTGALPRAWVVAHAAPMPDGGALTALRGGALDPRRTALVPPGVPRVASGGRYAPARARELDTQHWRIDLPPGRGGWLVFAASWSPLWDATVDGRDVDTHPTDYALVGLPVPAGAHTVQLRYRDKAAAWGLGLSIAGWLALAALALAGRHQSRKIA